MVEANGRHRGRTTLRCGAVCDEAAWAFAKCKQRVANVQDGTWARLSNRGLFTSVAAAALHVFFEQFRQDG
jgi:hypothetical protein